MWQLLRQRLSFILVTSLLVLVLLPVSSPFAVLPATQTMRHQSSWRLAAVTEAQVLAAVEEAETLWAEAMEARNKADEAAGKAEAIRAASSTEDGETPDGDAPETSHLSPKVLSLASLADGMEADTFIEEAEKYSQEADEIETKAEKALTETETLLEQHLKDFPDSPLADSDEE